MSNIIHKINDGETPCHATTTQNGCFGRVVSDFSAEIVATKPVYSGTAKIHVVLRDKQNPFDFSLLQHV
jgi:hypothetical protein